MKINFQWLKEFVTLEESASDVSALLTSIGLESEVVNPVEELPESVVVGRVLSCQKHPDADKLSVCVVEAGLEKPLQIICGAPNVKAGQIVPVALVGTRLPGFPKLKKVKIRGVYSEGMICSEKELGISEEHSTILVLGENYLVGKPFAPQYGKRNTIIELDITPNRPDCLGHIGVARELAAYYERELRVPAISLQESDELVSSACEVVIKDPDGCPRYAARVVKGVKVGPSPEWLRKRLESLGLRSINNVVDASNLVLMETGHPLHTFDYNLIKNHTIVVRFAREGEKIVTLDGEERELHPDILLICDPEKPVAIAGIMGGENSEVTEETRDVLIESAYFTPAVIRRGSKILGLSTEASYRFERGADPEGVIYALNRLAGIIQELAGGEVLKGYIDRYPLRHKPVSINLRLSQAEKVSGVNYDPEWVGKKLTLLGCEVERVNGSDFKVIAPSFRPDLEREIDLIEELVRLYGMWQIPSVSSFSIQAEENPDDSFDRVFAIKEYLVAQGMTECVSNSLVSYQETQFPFEVVSPVKLHNPLGPEMGYLRTSLLSGLINALKKNLNYNNRDLQLFELGRVFYQDQASETGAREEERLAMIVCGHWFPREWYTSPIENDIYRIKGILEQLLAEFSPGGYGFKTDENANFKHFWWIENSGRQLGYMGQLSPLVLKEVWDVEEAVYVLEINPEVLITGRRELKFTPFSSYPAVSRDLSIVVSEEVTWERIEEEVRKSGGDLIRQIKLYDIYKGKNIESGKKSFTFNVILQSYERTLKDSVVEGRMERIIEALKSKFGAQLR